MTQQQQTLENIAGKGEIARSEQFLPLPQCFLLNQIIVSPFVHIFDIISLFAADFEEPNIGISGKGLSLIHLKLGLVLLVARAPYLVLTEFRSVSHLLSVSHLGSVLDTASGDSRGILSE